MPLGVTVVKAVQPFATNSRVSSSILSPTKSYFHCVLGQVLMHKAVWWCKHGMVTASLPVYPIGLVIVTENQNKLTMYNSDALLWFFSKLATNHFLKQQTIANI